MCQRRQWQVLMDFGRLATENSIQADQAGHRQKCDCQKGRLAADCRPRRKHLGLQPEGNTPAQQMKAKWQRGRSAFVPAQSGHEATVVPISASSSRPSRGAPPVNS